MTFPRTVEALQNVVRGYSANNPLQILLDCIDSAYMHDLVSASKAEQALNALADLRDSLEGEMPEVCEAASKLVGGPL